MSGSSASVSGAIRPVFSAIHLASAKCLLDQAGRIDRSGSATIARAVYPPPGSSRPQRANEAASSS